MRRVVVAGMIVIGALIGTPPAGAEESKLSARLQELASRNLRDASRANQADAVDLARIGAGSLARADGGLVVEIRVDGNDYARSLALADAGAEIIHVSHEYDTITASVDETELRAIAAVPGIEYVGEAITPMVGSVEGDGVSTGAINTCQTGVVSEGNTQLRADVAKTQFDVDGSGVKVGILSDSYDTKPTATKHAADDIASNDLPGTANSCGRTTPVDVQHDFTCTPATNCGDEGRAMLQIVHDIAPGAALMFSTANNTQTVFADHIRELANAGADIIADDIIYLTEPMYQDGVIAKAVNDVTAQGVTYFSMAFNNNGNGVNSYEAAAGYRDDGATNCPATVLAHRPGGQDDCMDFDPDGVVVDNRLDVNIPAGGSLSLSLSWAEPVNAVTTDFDLYLINPNTGDSLTLSVANNNLTSQSPTEFGISGTFGASGNRQIVIRRYAGTGTPRLKVVSNDNGLGTISAFTAGQVIAAPDVVGPTIYGHNGADASITVGAVPFNNSNTMETFSSRGPVTSVFQPITGTATPAAAFPTPLTLNKPDLSATDKGITTFFGPGNRFGGTSAATPHAAAVGALQLSANPALTRDQIEAAQKATARPVGAFGPNDMGAGLIDAQAAIAANPTAPPTASITSGPSGTITTRTPTYNFTTTGRTKAVTCSVDGGAVQACANTFTTASLADGPHTVAVTATDFFDQTATDSRSITVDATGPTAPKFKKGPKKKTKSRKAKFTFSGEAGATFECTLDKKAAKSCTSPAKVKVKKAKPKPKKHKFTVAAIDALGNVGATATYKWTVVK